MALRAAACVALIAALPAPALDSAPKGMVLVPGGAFTMGYAGGHEDELPLHEVRLDPFYLDATEVTNRQFGAFVEETGHVSRAEENGYAWVFETGVREFQAVDGATWRTPHGPESSIEGKEDHPVVCVAWSDAKAYADWAGKRLPTEAEWEYAARGGRAEHFAAEAAAPSARDTTHGHLTPASHAADGATAGNAIQFVKANVWQGAFPDTNTLEDGHYHTAPAGSYSPNPFGLYDMIGNVWEWCADWYDAGQYTRPAGANPRGPETGSKRVARGGSWFCSPAYCGAYNTHFRGASPPEEAFANVGFRCAMDRPAGTERAPR